MPLDPMDFPIAHDRGPHDDSAVHDPGMAPRHGHGLGVRSLLDPDGSVTTVDRHPVGRDRDPLTRSAAAQRVDEL